MHGSSNCELKLTVLLTETEAACDSGLGSAICPGYLHAVCCRDAMMEPKQNRLKQSFAESSVSLPGCNNGMTFLWRLCSTE